MPTKKQSGSLRITKIVVFSIFLVALFPLLLPHFRIYFYPETGFNTSLNIILFIATFGLWLMSVHVSSADNLNDRRSVKWLAFLACVFFATAIGFHLYPIVFSQSLGAPAVYTLFATFIVFVLVFISRRLRLIFSLPILLVLVMIPFVRTINHQVPTLPVSKNPEDQSLKNPLSNCSELVECEFSSWLMTRPDLNAYRNSGRPYPVFLASSAGGGIYAAANAFSFLETAARRCPSFRQHLFLTSGVSGGSFGNALFGIDERFSQPIATLPECGEPIGEPRNKLAGDFFSPVLGAFIFGNFLQIYSPFELNLWRSGDMLSHSFGAVTGQKGFERSVNDHWQYTGTSPAMFFNTVQVDQGIPETIGPLRLRQNRLMVFDPNNALISFGAVPANVSIADAVSMSARFPFITPSARIIAKHPENEDEFVSRDYVDGGYFDNSGVGLLRSIIREIQDGSKEMSATTIDANSSELFCRSKFKKAAQLHCERSGDANCDPRKVELALCVDEAQVDLCSDFERALSRCGYNLNYGRQFDETCELNSESSCGNDYWRSGLIPVELMVIQIDSTSATREPRTQSTMDPLWALLNLRQNRGLIERTELRLLLCGFQNCHEDLTGNAPAHSHYFVNDQSQVPLTWSIGNAAVNLIRNSIGDPKLCKYFGDDPNDPRLLVGQDNNCTMRALVDAMEFKFVKNP